MPPRSEGEQERHGGAGGAAEDAAEAAASGAAALAATACGAWASDASGLESRRASTACDGGARGSTSARRVASLSRSMLWTHARAIGEELLPLIATAPRLCEVRDGEGEGRGQRGGSVNLVSGAREGGGAVSEWPVLLLWNEVRLAADAVSLSALREDAVDTLSDNARDAAGCRLSAGAGAVPSPPLEGVRPFVAMLNSLMEACGDGVPM
eukprot:6097106-Pleurochrysis_carterae.AAC.1